MANAPLIQGNRAIIRRGSASPHENPHTGFSHRCARPKFHFPGHSRTFPDNSGHFGDFSVRRGHLGGCGWKVSTMNTLQRCHEAWQGASVIETRLPCILTIHHLAEKASASTSSGPRAIDRAGRKSPPRQERRWQNWKRRRARRRCCPPQKRCYNGSLLARPRWWNW